MWQVRLLIAREQLHARLAQLGGAVAPPVESEAVTFKLVVLGSSRAGKTYLLNQVEILGNWRIARDAD